MHTRIYVLKPIVRAIACSALVILAARTAGAVSCGEVLGPKAGTVVLDSHLICPDEPVVTVVGPGTTLDLNGFYVTCSGSNSTGILVTGSGAKVKNGVVAECAVAAIAGSGRHKIEGLWSQKIRVDSDRNKISDCVTAFGDTDGFEIVGNDNLLKNNVAFSAGFNGFKISGDGNALKSNLAIETRHGFGFALFGAKDTKVIGNVSALNLADGFISTSAGNRFLKNLSVANDGNGSAGGFVASGTAADNRFQKNKALHNEGVGILVAGDGGMVSKNQVMHNTDGGIEIPTAASELKVTGNVSFGDQSTDMIEAESCADVQWKKNIFTTASDACVE